MSFVSHILSSVWNLQLRFVLRILSVKESCCTRVSYLQFGGDKLLEDVSRLGVEDPEERLVGKAWYLLPHAVDVVNGVAFR